MARELRENKMNSQTQPAVQKTAAQKKEEDEEEDQSPTRRWRLGMATARQSMAEEVKTAAAAPINLGTSRLLQAAWRALIPSFGLTLIYINIHVFMGQVIGEKFFCKLGDEWQAGLTAGGAKEIAGAFKKSGRVIGMVEVMALIFLDLAVFFIIMSILAWIAMIVDFMTANWLDKFARIIGGLTDIGWSGIKALYSIFKM